MPLFRIMSSEFRVMKIVAIVFSFLILNSTLLTPLSFAQNFKLPSTELKEDSFNASSPFYFLKTVKEDLSLVLNTSKSSKLKLQSELSFTRLNEANTLSKDKESNIPKTISRFEKHVEGMVSLKNEDLSKTAQNLATHLGMLQRLYAKTEDPKAKESIMRAMDNENNHIQNLLATTSPENRADIEKLVLFRQTEALRFLKKESTSSSLPKDYSQSLRERFEKREQSIKNNSTLGVTAKRAATSSAKPRIVNPTATSSAN